MRYEQFRDLVRNELRVRKGGTTWTVLKARLRLPQRTPCYTWIYRLEKEIGLRRTRGPRGMVWYLAG
jgi:hypothetical protein